MKFVKLRIAFLIFVVGIPGLRGSSSAPLQTSTVLLPIFPLKMNYDYEKTYMMQWIAGSPQYSMIAGLIAKEDPSVVQIVLTETRTERRVYYSNSEYRVKGLTQAGLTAHFAKIDFKIGHDNEDRPLFAFGFADEHNVPIRWGFVAASAGSDKGAGPRIQAVKDGLVICYNEIGTVSGESSVVQIGDKSYDVERWDEISKPPYFVGYRGTYSDGLTMGMLITGAENWQVQSAPSGLSDGAKWTLVDKKNVRELQVTSHYGDEWTITEIVPKATWARYLEMVVKSSAQGFALKSMTSRTGNDSMRITFAPEISFSAPSTSEHSFQVDQNDHQKVMVGTATIEGQGGKMTLKLQPKVENSGSRQPGIEKGYVLTSTITAESKGYKIDVK